jgi:endoglucanase
MIKRLSTALLATASLMMLSTAAFAQLPSPCKGWNLGNTLESTWGGPAPTQALINAVAAQGFNTIRVPCAWHYNSTNGTINSSYMTTVTNVVNWATAKGMYVVLNDHWDNNYFQGNSFASYDSNLNSGYMNMWTQVANAFKNYDGHVLFACTNEPQTNTQAGTNVLFQYYRNWVPTIRNTGGNNSTRWLILQAGQTNPDGAVAYINSSIWPSDSANHLMLECHWYDPFQFSQLSPDASWGNMFYFWGAQYHVTSGPTNRNATWGEESTIDAAMSELKTNFANKGIPVIIGEFQAHEKPAESDLTGQYITQNYNSATYWNYYVQTKAVANGLYPMYWTIPGQDFNWTTGAVVDQNRINAALGKSYIGPVAGLGGGGGTTGTTGGGTYSSNIANGNHTLAPQNATGSRLDANGTGTTNGTKVQIWSANNASNQSWNFTNTGSGVYNIKASYNTNLCLDVNGNSSTNGAIVQLWACSGTNNQKWGAVSDGGSIYEFAPQNATGSRLDVTGASSTNGTQIEIWAANSASNQKWAVN